MSLGILNQTTRAPPDKCTVYWDYENMPIPKKANLSDILSTIKDKLWTLIGSKLPVEFKVYIRASKLTKDIQNGFDINGVVQIQIPSSKPESVDKRLMIDMTFSLYELERDNKSRALALISGDKDFGHLLSKIQNQPPISNTFLILLRYCPIDINLSNVVDHIIQLEYGNKNGEQKSDDHKKQNKKIKPKRNNITVKIKNLIDLTNTFDYKTTITNQVENIKYVIWNKNKKKCKTAQKNQCILYFKGKEMKAGVSLKKCGIVDGDTIMWLYDKHKKDDKNKKVKQQKILLKLQNLNDSEIIEVNIRMKNKIQHLRDAIYSRNKKKLINSTQQIILFYDGKKLIDKQQINAYNIKDGDTLLWDIDPNYNDNKQKKNKPKIMVTLQHEQNEYNNIHLQSTLVNYLYNIITSLKQKLNLEPNKHVSLIWKGKTLNENKNLKNYDITENVILFWKITNQNEICLSKEDNYMYPKIDLEMKKQESNDDDNITVIVQNEMNAATLIFTMNTNNSILDLKTMIEKRLSIAINDQKLIFNDKLLENNDNTNTLKQYGFCDGNNTINLKINVIAVKFNISVLGDDIIKDITCWNNISILDLKREISNRCGLNTPDQILKYNGNEMIDSHCLYNYGIKDGQVIKLTLQSTIV